MLQRLGLRHRIDDLESVASAEDVLNCQLAVRSMRMKRWVVTSCWIIQETRQHPDLSLGGSR